MHFHIRFGILYHRSDSTERRVYDLRVSGNMVHLLSCGDAQLFRSSNITTVGEVYACPYQKSRRPRKTSRYEGGSRDRDGV